MNYSEKLKDPRWQKKRLEILNRDRFTCMHCNSTSKELHVHHLSYSNRKNPWDADEDSLTTLCVDCHKREEDFIRATKELIEMICLGCGTISGVYETLYKDIYG